MEEHSTSALRDAIFSLHSSSAGANGDGQLVEGDVQGDAQAEAENDPHLALLDLSHVMPDGGDDGTGGASSPGAGAGTDDININIPLSGSTGGPGGSGVPAGGGLSGAAAPCPHLPLVPHILALLTAHALEPKPGSNTPLTLGVFAPLSRSLRLFHALAHCPHCSTSPHQTLPQLALLSRTTTILTFPFPPVNSSVMSGTAQITVHGAKLTGTGLSEAIEQHIVGVVWDSWRASVREIFNGFERKAQEVIQAAAQQTEGPPTVSSSPETQRAGLMFQAMSRLSTAMDEVEGN